MKKVKMEFVKMLPKWDGCTVDCTIEGDEIVGGRIILQDDRFGILQNKRDGFVFKELFGYSYSWTIGDGTIQALIDHNVTISKIYLSDMILEFTNSSWIFIDRRVVDFDSLVDKDCIKVGCTEIPYATVEKVYNKIRSIKKQRKTKTV